MNAFPAETTLGTRGFVFRDKKSLLFKFVLQFRGFPLPDDLRLPKDSVYFISIDDIAHMSGEVLVVPESHVKYLDVSIDRNSVLPVCWKGEMGLGCFTFHAYLNCILEILKEAADEDILDSLPEDKLLFASMKDIVAHSKSCFQLVDRTDSRLIPNPFADITKNGATDGNAANIPPKQLKGEVKKCDLATELPVEQVSTLPPVVTSDSQESVEASAPKLNGEVAQPVATDSIDGAPSELPIATEPTSSADTQPSAATAVAVAIAIADSVESSVEPTTTAIALQIPEVSVVAESVPPINESSAQEEMEMAENGEGTAAYGAAVAAPPVPPAPTSEPSPPVTVAVSVEDEVAPAAEAAINEPSASCAQTNNAPDAVKVCGEAASSPLPEGRLASAGTGESTDSSAEEEHDAAAALGDEMLAKRATGAQAIDDAFGITAGPVAHLRIPGPSNVHQGSPRRNRLFSKPFWSFLAKTVGWRDEDWSTAKGSTKLHMIVAPAVKTHPLSVESSGLVENIEYFHNLSAFDEHVQANPCLVMSWKELWPLLHAQGWRWMGSGQQEFWYVYHQQRDGEGEAAFVPVVGVHKFASLFSLMKFVARFPYPLQSDQTLQKTLTALRVDVTSFANIADIRRALWTNPSMILASLVLPQNALSPLRISQVEATLRYEPFTASSDGIENVFTVLDLIRARKEKRLAGVLPEIHRRLAQLGWKVSTRHTANTYVPPWHVGGKCTEDDMCWDPLYIAALAEKHGLWALFKASARVTADMVKYRPKTVQELLERIVGHYGAAEFCLDECRMVPLLQHLGWALVNGILYRGPAPAAAEEGTSLSEPPLRKYVDYFDLSDLGARQVLLCNMSSLLEMPLLSDPKASSQEDEGQEDAKPQPAGLSAKDKKKRPPSLSSTAMQHAKKVKSEEGQGHSNGHGGNGKNGHKAAEGAAEAVAVVERKAPVMVLNGNGRIACAAEEEEPAADNGEELAGREEKMVDAGSEGGDDDEEEGEDSECNVMMVVE